MFVCSECGEEYIQWQGRCSVCGNWNTLKEMNVPAETRYTGTRSGYSGGTAEEPVVLANVVGQQEQRVTTGFSEVDRVLGGGIVQGSVILLGGDPGIGKSTLLLQVVAKMAHTSTKPILYISGEESPAQIKLRAERLGIHSEMIHLLPTTNVETIQATIEKTDPALVIVDSIQTMYDPQFPSSPGSIVQVRESAIRIQHVAKSLGVPVVLVGHITKEGTVAGPRTLEHLVDVVLYLEGDTQQTLRILRAVKNRFGDISEAGIFSMEDKGMVEVTDPSRFLLSERVQSPGSVLAAIIEGTRPMLIEVQALTTPTVFGYPRRTASGFDLNRLNLLLAVLQRRVHIDLSSHDVFINIVGGLSVKDPAVDAAVCVALASAYKDVVLSPTLCVLGEVGLAGEIRKVIYQERRIKEVQSLGYQVVDSVKDLAQLVQKVVRPSK